MNRKKPSFQKELFESVSFKGPLSFCRDEENCFFIVDELDHSVSLFGPDEKCLWQVKGLHYPSDCLYSEGLFWVIDRYHHSLKAFDRQGKELQTRAPKKGGAFSLTEPFGIAAGKDCFYVTDAGSSTFKCLQGPEDPVTEYGIAGPGVDYYSSPLFKKQSVYKTWLRSQTRFYTLETMFFKSGFTSGNIENPRGIACCGEWGIAVADLSGYIQVFDEKGDLKKHFRIEGCPQWLQYDEGILFYSKEFSNRIEAISLDGKEETEITLAHEIGKFTLYSRDELIYIAPWEKKIFKVQLQEDQ